MNNQTEEVFEKLKKDVTAIYCYRLLYKQLFLTSVQRVNLINDTTPAVFVLLQNMIEDQLFNEFDKLLDRNDCKDDEKYSLTKIIILLEGQMELEKIHTLERIYNEIISKTAKLAGAKSEEVSQSDIIAAMKSGVKWQPGISDTDVDEVINMFGIFLNVIERYFYNTETSYETIVIGYQDDGVALLKILAKSLAYNDLVKQKIIPTDFWMKFGRVDK